ncbi:transcriptional regulator [Gordoniibacillus kamchatkensis]|uniref:Transcriptional regulator n=1 Tax=Gordoniibacillus kamchatkensis TaxID=1590651 RepID=A0ABR5ABI4_9BACL|nr:MurR/RpiR family transcriptional regulator [Paenibacillus sp. VKM B-2647]KIL38257.1 transcriptional regulator [Paenibacillus sp. VKM B-2647]
MTISNKLHQTSNTLLLISSIYSSLTKAEKKVADFVLNNPEDALLSTITDLSEKSAVGDTSVIRFCRKLGFRGFHDFKLSLAQNLVNAPVQLSGEINYDDDTDSVARKITQNNEQMLRNTLNLIDPATLNQAVSLLMNGNRIFVYGVGSSGITAMDVHYRFMRIGLSAEVQRDAHIIAMSASLVGKGDIVFGISHSGSTKDLVDPIRQAKENGAKVICLTGHAKSPITHHADIVLLVPSKESPFEGGALSTKIGHIHMIEILSTLLTMNMKDKAAESIRKTAGSVADKLY